MSKDEVAREINPLCSCSHSASSHQIRSKETARPTALELRQIGTGNE